MATDPREPGSNEGDETGNREPSEPSERDGEVPSAVPPDADLDAGDDVDVDMDEEEAAAAESASAEPEALEPDPHEPDPPEAHEPDPPEAHEPDPPDALEPGRPAPRLDPDPSAMLIGLPSAEYDLADDDILSLDEAGASIDFDEDLAAGVEEDLDDVSPHFASPPPAPHPASGPPSPSIEPARFEIEVPTALDRYLERESTISAEERIAELAAALEVAPAARKGEIAYELGELYLSALGDEAKAVKAHGVALRADPSLRANLWAIRRIFYRRALWPNLIKLIGAELRFVSTPRDRADLELERGRIHEDHGGDGEAAKQCYLRAVGSDPSYVPALLALERRCLIDADRQTLAMVWRELATSTLDEERKLTYLVDLARALTERGDGSAFDVLDEAAALGDPATVSRERMRAARALADPEQMVLGLEEQVAAQLATLGPAGLPPPTPRAVGSIPDPAESVRLTIVAARRRQAQILSRELADEDRAWSALEQALAARPGDELVLADLADLAEVSGRFDELAELVAAWQAQESAPERARALALRRVSALRRSGDAAAAGALLSQLAASYPGYLAIAAIREADALGRGDITELANIFAELGESAELGAMHGEDAGAPEPAIAAELFTAAAGACQLAGDLDRARTLFARALEVDPSADSARDGLIVCLERSAQWDAVITELRDRLDPASDPHWRLRASHAALAAGDKEKALELLASVGVDLSSGELLWLAALAISCGDSDREAFAFETAASREADADVAAEMYARAGRTLEQSDPERAARLYRLALAARPDDSLVRGALAAFLRQRQDWQGLAEELREGAGGKSDPRGPAAAWLELASLYEDQLGDRKAAAEAYREVLEVEPESAVALGGLARTTDGEERTDALVRASHASELGTGLVASLELARVQIEADVLEGASQAAERALRCERDLGRRSRAGAILAIEIAGRARDPAGIAEALEVAADGASATVRAELLAAAGWQRFLAGDPLRGAELFASARKEQPGNHSALLGAVLLADGEDEAASAETLAAAVSGDALAVSMLRGAGIHAAVSGDGARALELLARAVRRAPDDLSAAIALTEMTVPGDAEADAAAIAYGRRAELGGASAATWTLARARCLAAAGRLAEAGALALELSQSRPIDPAPVALLAEVCRQGGDNAAEAAARIELAGRVVCDAARARHLRRAAAIYDGLSLPKDAARAYWQLCELDQRAPELGRLAEILASLGDYGSLWELTSFQIDRAETAAERAAALVERARVRAQIADRHGAIRDLLRARSEDAEVAEAAGAADLEAEVREWVELPASADPAVVCASIAERAESLTDGAARARELVDLATICRDALGDRARAAAAIATARSLDPTNLEAAARAGEVAEAAQAIREALENQGGHRAGYQKLAAALELLGDTGESELVREVADALGGAPRETSIDLGPLADNRRPLEPTVFEHLSRHRRASGASEAAAIVWDKIADAISRGNDPSPADLGIELSDRISVRELGKRSPVAAALYERLRLHAEIFIAPGRREWSLVTSANRQMIFLSADVADADQPRTRFLLGVALMLSKERTGTLVRLPVERVATYFAAARAIAGVSGPPLGAVASEVPACVAALESLLPARVAAELAELGEALAALERPAVWVSEAQRRADRFGVVISGNVAEAARAAAPRGRSISSDPRALELLAFAASDAHLELRRALGLGR